MTKLTIQELTVEQLSIERERYKDLDAEDIILSKRLQEIRSAKAAIARKVLGCPAPHEKPKLLDALAKQPNPHHH